MSGFWEAIVCPLNIDIGGKNFSEKENLKHGLAQGSVQVPLLFMI